MPHITKVLEKFDEEFKDDIYISIRHMDVKVEKVKDFIKQSHKEYLLAEVERLKGKLYKDKKQECSCRGWDNAIQSEIEHKLLELKEMEAAFLVNNITRYDNKNPKSNL